MPHPHDRAYIRNPGLELSRLPDGVVIENLVTGKRIEASAALLKVWEAFASARALGDGSPVLATGVIDFLLHHELVVPAAEADTVATGLLRPSRKAVGSAVAWTELAVRELSGQWCVFGVPVAYDCVRPHSPVGGPEAIRGSLALFSSSSASDAGGSGQELWDWNRGRSVRPGDVSPLDVGDICHRRRTDTAEAVERKVRLAAREIFAAGGRPLVLGGEHWLTLPVLQAAAEHHDGITVIHLDAHSDRYAARKHNQAGLTNGNVMSYVESLDSVRRLVQIGIREFDRAADPQLPPLNPGKTRVVSAAEVLAGGRGGGVAGVGEPLADIPQGSPVYLSIDADVLDPSVAPEVAWPVMGGLSFREVDAIVLAAAERFEVIGADLVEVTSSESGRNLAAMALAGFARSLLLAGE